MIWCQFPNSQTFHHEHYLDVLKLFYPWNTWKYIYFKVLNSNFKVLNSSSGYPKVELLSVRWCLFTIDSYLTLKYLTQPKKNQTPVRNWKFVFVSCSCVLDKPDVIKPDESSYGKTQNIEIMKSTSSNQCNFYTFMILLSSLWQ